MAGVERIKQMASLIPKERIARLQLIRSQNIGPVTFKMLLTRFGSAVEALNHLPELNRRAGGRRITIYSAKKALEEMEKLKALGGAFVMIGDEDYPPLLESLDHSPPVLSVLGFTHLLKRRGVAIIGTRHASASALTLCAQMAYDISREDLTIISGLALGIDTKAHHASLKNGTIAVVAGGLDVIYPPQNEDLFHKICESGCVVSEMTLGQKPRAQHFPRRNRIISGLALLCVIVEAPLRSGAMITARIAAEQGRLVCAVPGSPMDPRSHGANQLLRDGATLVENGEDVLRELAPLLQDHVFEAKHKPAFTDKMADFSPKRQDYDDILSLLSPTPAQLDQLIRLSNKPSAIVNVILNDLEIAGRVHRDLGNRVSLLAQKENIV